MSQELTADAWKRQQELIESVRATRPELLERNAPPDQNLVLGRIGVTFLPADRPQGYLRLTPQDFLVEEIAKDGRIARLSAGEPFQDAEDRRTLWADLVKASISHPHAMSDLQKVFGIDANRVGYAGIKDALALTCQRITLRGVTREQAEITHPHLLLRPVAYGSGALQPGDLMGNRFTIVVRAENDASIDPVMEKIRTEGFLNFFGSQRFGTRLVSHRMGQKLLQGDIDGTLKIYFGEPGLFDVPLFREVREAMANLFGDWEAMKNIAARFPYTMHEEIKVLDALIADPRKTRMALGQIQSQVKMWIYAYGSWLINRRMSQAVERGEKLPDALALPLGSHGPLPEYREFMQNDGTLQYLEGLKLFPYVQPSDKTIQARMIPGDLAWKRISAGWIIRFALGKGAYATSFLSHAFRLSEGMPVPEWVNGDEVDALKEIGDGSIEELKKRFAEVLVRRDLVKETEEEETA